MWSLGVILFLFLSGTVPFGANAATESEVRIGVIIITIKCLHYSRFVS